MVNITNYFERATALLASQFQIKNPDGSLTNLQKLISALCMQAQELNTQEQALQTQRYLNIAVGVQLDNLGEILGLARIPGQSDASYREDLQFQIFVIQSNGTPEEVIAILKYITDASIIWYDENYPAGYTMATNGLLFPTNPSDLFAFLQSVSPAGVEFTALIATYDTVPFVFSSDPIIEQFYVRPNVLDISQINPFQVNPGSGDVDFYVNNGQTVNPNFGGHFSEALGVYHNYTYDDIGAGQMPESIQTNGNLPLGY